MRLVIRMIVYKCVVVRYRVRVVILILLNTRCPPRHYIAAIEFFIVSLLLLLSLLLREKKVLSTHCTHVAKQTQRREVATILFSEFVNLYFESYNIDKL